MVLRVLDDMPEEPLLDLPPLSEAGLVMTGVSTISLVDDLVSPFSSVTTTTVVRVEGGRVVTDSSGVDESFDSLGLEVEGSVGVGAGVVLVLVSDVTGGSSEVDGVDEGGVVLGVVDGGGVVDGVVSREEGVVEGGVVLGPVVLRVKLVVSSSSPRVT